MEIMLDSGSSVSLIRQDIAKCLNGTTSAGDTPKLRLVSAGGEELPIVNSVKASVAAIYREMRYIAIKSLYRETRYIAINIYSFRGDFHYTYLRESAQLNGQIRVN